MKSNKTHDNTAKRIAKRYGGQCNSRKGADIPLPTMTIEVETENTIGDAPRQLQGYRNKVYIATTTKKGIEKAIERAKGTTIGVMNNEGSIIKKSTRKR